MPLLPDFDRLTEGYAQNPRKLGAVKCIHCILNPSHHIAFDKFAAML